MIKIISPDMSYLAILEKERERNSVLFSIYVISEFGSENEPIGFGEPAKKESELTIEDSLISGLFKNDLSLEAEFTEDKLFFYGWEEFQSLTAFIKLISNKIEDGVIPDFKVEI